MTASASAMCVPHVAGSKMSPTTGMTVGGVSVAVVDRRVRTFVHEEPLALGCCT